MKAAAFSRTLSLGCVLASAFGCASHEVAPIQLDLASYARIASLEDVCPDARTDALCTALREADRAEPDAAAAAYARVRETLRREAEPTAGSGLQSARLSDPAARWYLRERGLGLVVWNTLAAQSEPPREPQTYAAAADEILSRLFPVYEPQQFRAARVRLPPEGACGSASVAFVFFPGVVRVPELDEFAASRARLEAEFPCAVTYKVETGTFITPTDNAREGCRALERVAREQPEATVHAFAYSQGVRNALETFVTCPAASEPVRSLFALNSAAHGSPVADALALAMPLPGLEEAQCVGRGSLSRWWCEHVDLPSFGTWQLARAALRTQGTPPDDRDTYEHDGERRPVPARVYTKRRLAGTLSLSTYGSAEFWRAHGDALPRHLLYFSFRSIITDEKRNLPASNRAFYRIVFQAGGTVPWNDMQVRLVDQQLGGPLAEQEIVWPVAEGNHWQWALESHQVPGLVMSDAMFEGFPRSELLLAHAMTLAEVGELRSR